MQSSRVCAPAAHAGAAHALTPPQPGPDALPPPGLHAPRLAPGPRAAVCLAFEEATSSAPSWPHSDKAESFLGTTEPEKGWLGGAPAPGPSRL